jgi:hypothetical protein
VEGSRLGRVRKTSRCAGLLLLVTLLIAACTTSTDGTPSATQAAPSTTASSSAAPTTGAAALPGTYTLVGDVGGTQVKTGATVTLILKTDGTVDLSAKQPGETATDSGTWTATGSTITLAFTDDLVADASGTFEFDGTKLTLPVLVFGEGAGKSEWTRTGGPDSTGTSGTSPPPTTGPATPRENHFDQWDLAGSAAAAGTKVYSEAVAKGTPAKDAVQQAATAAKAVSGVSGATISKNGRNIRVTYADGGYEEIITERLMTPEESAATPAVTTLLGAPGGCVTMPGASADATEPGREAVNPRGGYSVNLYDPNIQPKPVTSADSPPADSRRALLIAPQYDVPHPLHGETKLYSIRDVAGDNIECISGSLTKAGYAIDSILGSVTGGKRANTGDDAVQQMITQLTTKKYGVVYFLGHGYTDATTDAFTGILMGPVNLDRPEIKAIQGGKKIDRAIAALMTKKYADLLGLTWNDADPPIALAPDDDGTPTMVVRAPLFAQLKAKGMDLSKSLLVLNACSSAVASSFPQAAGSKAYIGWNATMSGEFISRASESFFDVLTDKARTVRMATQVWQLHEIWRTKSLAAPSENESHKSLTLLGQNFQKYDVIDAQTYILIFAIRLRPSPPTSDIKNTSGFVQNCYDQIWKARKGALASPQCHALRFGNDFPTEGQVVDAQFETGARSVGGGAGRWTLAD